MKKLLEYFLPAYFYRADTDLQRRMRLSVSIAISFIPIILFYQSLFIFVLHNRLASFALILGIVSSVFALFLLRKGSISFKVFAHYYICLALTIHTINVCTSGGTGSTMISGYLVMPLIAALLLNRFATYVWSVIGLLSIVLLGVLEKYFGVRFGTSYPAELVTEVHIVLATAIFTVSMIFVLLMQSGLDATLFKLSSQNKELTDAYKESENLLLNILPSEVAREIKVSGHTTPKTFSMVTVMFTDFKDFTSVSQKVSAELLVSELDYCFSAFDSIIQKYKIEKIKTIGDSYMCASGLPVLNYTHAVDMVNAAMEVEAFMEDRKKEKKSRGEFCFEIRIGIHTGPVVAGIVGIKKYSYDIWGDTVNIASRMESCGNEGKINISGTTYELVKDKFKCIYRGKIQAKNKGEIDMYFVVLAI
jgi:class 3 adenylate cyclase